MMVIENFLNAPEVRVKVANVDSVLQQQQVAVYYLSLTNEDGSELFFSFKEMKHLQFVADEINKFTQNQQPTTELEAVV